MVVAVVVVVAVVLAVVVPVVLVAPFFVSFEPMSENINFTTKL